MLTKSLLSIKDKETVPFLPSTWQNFVRKINYRPANIAPADLSDYIYSRKDGEYLGIVIGARPSDNILIADFDNQKTENGNDWNISDDQYNKWRNTFGDSFKAPQIRTATVGINKGRIRFYIQQQFMDRLYFGEK